MAHLHESKWSPPNISEGAGNLIFWCMQASEKSPSLKPKRVQLEDTKNCTALIVIDIRYTYYMVGGTLNTIFGAEQASGHCKLD